MVIYPIPVEVTQARVQLAVDHARSAAIEAAIENFDSEESPLVDVKV